MVECDRVFCKHESSLKLTESEKLVCGCCYIRRYNHLDVKVKTSVDQSCLKGRIYKMIRDIIKVHKINKFV